MAVEEASAVPPSEVASDLAPVRLASTLAGLMVLGAVAQGLSSVIQVWHIQTGANPAFRGLPGHGQSVTDRLRDLEQGANPLVALLFVAAAAFCLWALRTENPRREDLFPRAMTGITGALAVVLVVGSALALLDALIMSGHGSFFVLAALSERAVVVMTRLSTLAISFGALLLLAYRETLVGHVPQKERWSVNYNAVTGFAVVTLFVAVIALVLSVTLG